MAKFVKIFVKIVKSLVQICPMGLSLKWFDDDENALKSCDSSSPLRSLDML